MHRFFTLMLVLVGAYSQGNALYAQPCTHEPSGGGETLQGSIVTPDKSCTIVPNGYIKQGRTLTGSSAKYRLDFLATATGECELRGVDCSSGTCLCVKNYLINPNPELRAVSNVKSYEFNSTTSSGYFLGMVVPVENGVQVKSQSVDTNVAGTTNGPILWTPYYLGKVTIQWAEIIYTTACNIPPGMKTYELPVHVVKCKPEYNVPDGHPDITIHLPRQPIQIYIPAVLIDLVTTATNVANDYTTGLGVSVTVVQTPCTGAGCVNVKTGEMPTDPETGQKGCSAWEADYGADGTTTRAEIVFPPDYRTKYPNEGTRRRYMAHELGHLLGLDENEEVMCFPADSIMSSSDPCGTSYSGAQLSPQLSDFTPINNSVYGTAPRQACGF